MSNNIDRLSLGEWAICSLLTPGATTGDAKTLVVIKPLSLMLFPPDGSSMLVAMATTPDMSTLTEWEPNKCASTEEKLSNNMVSSTDAVETAPRVLARNSDMGVANDSLFLVSMTTEVKMLVLSKGAED